MHTLKQSSIVHVKNRQQRRKSTKSNNRKKKLDIESSKLLWFIFNGFRNILECFAKLWLINSYAMAALCVCFLCVFFFFGCVFVQISICCECVYIVRSFKRKWHCVSFQLIQHCHSPRRGGLVH